MESVKLTPLEKQLLLHMLKENCSCAKTPDELYQDNMSCHDMESFHDRFPEYTAYHIGGILSSLIQKKVVYLMERDDDTDLFWVNDNYLLTLPQEETWSLELIS